MLGCSDQNKETCFKTKGFGIQQKGLLFDDARLAHLANPVPDRCLGAADDLGNIVQRLPPVLLQLHKYFPIQIIQANTHFTFPFFLEQPRQGPYDLERMFLILPDYGAYTGIFSILPEKSNSSPGTSHETFSCFPRGRRSSDRPVRWWRCRACKAPPAAQDRSPSDRLRAHRRPRDHRLGRRRPSDPASSRNGAR